MKEGELPIDIQLKIKVYFRTRVFRKGNYFSIL